MKRRTKQRIKRRTTKRRTRQRYKGAAFPRTYPPQKKADTAFKKTLRSSVVPSGKPPMRLKFPELTNPQKLPSTSSDKKPASDTTAARRAQYMPGALSKSRAPLPPPRTYLHSSTTTDTDIAEIAKEAAQRKKDTEKKAAESQSSSDASDIEGMVISVICPEGVVAGDIIETKYGEKIYTVPLPEGVNPGEEFLVKI
ncbi:MAG: hypothetical protein CME61_09765 [Halobacteriovoraceae bacterium]|nr:hypothetical protein [Halobacteriovoraceae bacterium]